MIFSFLPIVLHILEYPINVSCIPSSLLFSYHNTLQRVPKQQAISHLQGRQHCTGYSTSTGRWWAFQGRRNAANPTERSGPSGWWTGSTAPPTPPSRRLWRLWPLVCRARCRSHIAGCSSQSVLTRYTGQAQSPEPDTPPDGEDGEQAGRVRPHLRDPPCTCGCGRFEVGRGCSWAPVEHTSWEKADWFRLMNDEINCQLQPKYARR